MHQLHTTHHTQGRQASKQASEEKMSADPAAKLFICDLPHIQPNDTGNTSAAAADSSDPPSRSPLPFTYRGRAFGRAWVQVRVCIDARMHVSPPLSPSLSLTCNIHI